MSAPFQTALQNIEQSFAHSFAHVSPAVAGVLVASVWRGVLLACIVAVALRMVRRLSATTRSAIWLGVLAAVVALPVLPVLQATHVDKNTQSGFVHIDPRWSYALVGVWLVFSLLRVLQLAMSAWQLWQLARDAEPLEASASVLSILRGSRRHVLLCTSSDVDRPSVAGFLRPCILIPSGLLAKLTEAEMEQIVLHEMEHLRRYDDWSNLLQKICVALLPLHPVVLWLDRRLCLERELACDDGVMQATKARTSYAECLTNLAEHSLVRRGVSLALGAVGSWQPRSEVAKRVCRILARPESTMGRTQARVTAGALLAGVVGCAVFLAHTPRLINFTPAVQQEASATNFPAPEAKPLEMVAAHAVLASATTPAAHAVFAKATAAKKLQPRMVRTELKSSQVRKPAGERTQQQTAQPPTEPLVHMTAWHEDDVSAPRFALAVQEDSQLVYAAVPVRGGWLIVQL